VFATCGWLLAPFIWALAFRRRPGVRSRERAVGLMIGHVAYITLAAVILACAAAFGAGPG